MRTLVANDATPSWNRIYRSSTQRSIVKNRPLNPTHADKPYDFTDPLLASFGDVVR